MGWLLSLMFNKGTAMDNTNRIMPRIQQSLRLRLALTTALASVTFGYGLRSAQAGVCTPGVPGTYSCSGAEAVPAGSDPLQSMTPGSAVTVTTTAGFGIDTSNTSGSAINISGSGGVSFTDAYSSAFTSYGTAISATNIGSGSVTVTTGGTVNASSGTGVNVGNLGTTDSLTVTTGSVTSSGSAINAEQRGSGDATITANGPLISTSREGIRAYNYGANMTIEAGSITAQRDGVRATHYGTGALDITTTGTTESTFFRGIYASSSYGYYATDLTINAENVDAAREGIRTSWYGSGSQTITATGTITAGIGSGIHAYQSLSGAAISITANNVSSINNGILTFDYGSGTSTIDVNGTVTGGVSGAGIQVIGVSGKRTDITLNAGANVSSGFGTAILNNASIANVTVNSGATLSGVIDLGGGNDSTTFDGGDFSGVTSFNGGADADTLSFRNTSGTVASGAIINTEYTNIENGAAISVSGTLDTDLSVTSGGTLSAGASPGLLNVVGNLDLGAGATTLFEIGGLTAGSGYDQIDVTDDLTTGGTIEGIATLDPGTSIDVDWFGGFSAGLGDFFDVLVADSFSIADFGLINFDFSGAALGFGLDWDATIVSAGGGRSALRLSVVEGDAVAVSEPSSLALFGAAAGLAALGRARRARRPRKRITKG